MNLIFALMVSLLVLVQDDASKQARDLIERLRSEKAEDRDEATRKLKELGNAAKQELEKASKDNDAEVAQRIESVLRAIVVRKKLTPNLLKNIPGIEDRLVSTDNHTWTVEFLQATEYENGIPRYPALGTKDLECLTTSAIRGLNTGAEMEQVFEAIEQRSLRSAAPGITRFLEDKKQTVRFNAVQLLGKLAVKETAPKIIPLLNDENDSVRGLAADALGVLGVKEAIPPLIKALNGTDLRLREKAAIALGKLHAIEAIPELVKQLKSSHRTGRSSAVRALQDLRATDAVPDLVGLLKDPDDNLRSDVLRALASMDARNAILDITSLLSDSNQTVRRAAARALADLNAKEHISDIAKLLEEAGENSMWVRGDAARALAVLDAREEIPKISKLLADEDSYVRSMGAETLGKLGAKEKAGEIAKLLQDKDWMAVNGALKGLSELGSRDKITEIAQTLNNTNSSVRSTAIWALEHLEAKDQTGEIAKLLTDPSVQIRLAASEALCMMGSRQGVPVLLKECADLSWPIHEGRWIVSIGKSSHALNALRERDAWMRVRKVTVPVELEGTRKAVAESAAKDAGFSLEWSSSISPEDDPWISDSRRVPRWIKKRTLLDELETLAQGQIVGNRSPRYEFILERDRIRIVTYDEALKIWQSWWSEEQNKK